MRTLAEFLNLNLHRLNLPEHVNFFTDFIALTERYGGAALHYEDADMARLRQLHAMEQDLVARSSAHIETAEMQELEQQRDVLGQYVIDTVRSAQNMPIASKAADARELWIVLSPYVGFYDMPNKQETAAIDGMVSDLEKEENAPRVASLGLTDFVAELKRVNTEYRALYVQRMEARNAGKTADSKTIRPEMDALYKFITTVAFAHNVVSPSEQIAAYISIVNTLIGETNASYNQRTGNTKAEGEGEPLPPPTIEPDSSTTPEPTPTPDPEPTPDPTPDTGEDDDDEGGLAG